MPIDKIQLPPDIQTRPIGQLLPYAQNPKIHSDDQIAAIAGSMQEFGFTNPVLIDPKGEIIAGHGRILAAETLGIDSVPVVVLPHLNETQRRAYRIADNKLAERAEWSPDMLRLEFDALDVADFDLDLTGFSAKEIGAILRETEYGRSDEDDVPDRPKNPVTQPGEVWLLGKHRLLCGDATNADNVDLLLGKDKPHLMVTDPPYGVDFDPTWRRGSEKRTYMGSTPDKEVAWAEVWRHFSGDVVYVWHAGSHSADVFHALQNAEFKLRQQIIWNKMRFIIGRGDYSYNHEACFYGVRKNGKSHWNGARNQPTVWDIVHNASGTNHGAQKPVECMRRPLLNNSKKGELVYDPFVGSGTTIIAAETSERRCLAIEIDPGYCDVVIERWEDMTGEKSKLA